MITTKVFTEVREVRRKHMIHGEDNLRHLPGEVEETTTAHICAVRLVTEVAAEKVTAVTGGMMTTIVVNTGVEVSSNPVIIVNMIILVMMIGGIIVTEIIEVIVEVVIDLIVKIVLTGLTTCMVTGEEKSL